MIHLNCFVYNRVQNHYHIVWHVIREEDVNRPSPNHVGFEPSGRAFNEFCLNREGKPHNPLINAGAVMVSSMIHTAAEPAHRFEVVQNFIRRLAGNSPGIGYDNSVFLSEKHHADRNISLAYYMRESGAFPSDPTPPTSSDIADHLDLYFASCSITCNCDAGAVIAASLSNHGTCPVTNEEVCDPDITKDCLAIMYSCGMYDFSGQFAFEIGLPAKSGVAGSLLLCIPNVGGLCIWSPRLDVMGNSSRGVAFCKEFTKRTNAYYHIFNAMMVNSKDMKAKHVRNKMTLDVFNQRLIHCASMNLLDDMKNLLSRHALSYIDKDSNENIDNCVKRLLDMGDYDKRCPLHLAAAEGHVDMLKYLLSKGIDSAPKDRWGNTPFFEATKCLNECDDAEKRSNYLEIVSILSSLPTTKGINNGEYSDAAVTDTASFRNIESFKSNDKVTAFENVEDEKDLSKLSYETPTTVTAVTFN